MTASAEFPKALPAGVFPPEAAELDGFRLRRAELGDAEALHEAVKASFDELHPWMPWCTDPVVIGDQHTFLDRSVANWASGTAFNYFIIDAGDALIGTISLMDRIGPGGLEIGYWLRTGATGRGVMTRAAAWATDVALGLPDIDRVEIHCDAANVRSAAVPRRLGYRLVREVAQEPTAPGESGMHQIWVTG
jgi:RimJ/RimL family protein N-acetyltransferase